MTYNHKTYYFGFNSFWSSQKQKAMNKMKWWIAFDKYLFSTEAFNTNHT